MKRLPTWRAASGLLSLGLLTPQSQFVLADADNAADAISHHWTLTGEHQYRRQDPCSNDCSDQSAQLRLSDRLQWQSLTAQIYLDQQTSQHEENLTRLRLAELSAHWQPEDGWQLRAGRFSQDFERATVMQPMAFFQTAAAPFDQLADPDGLWMVSATHWLDDWTLTAVLAEANRANSDQPGTSEWQPAAGEATPKQWGLAAERDFESLSVTLLAQQYQGRQPGLGVGYSRVIGSSWQLVGSSFIRQGSHYLSGYQQSRAHLLASLPTTSADAVAAQLPDLQRSDSGWYPRLSQGIQWSGLTQMLQLELHYDRRKLSADEQQALYQLSDSSSASSTADTSTSPSAESTAFSNAAASLGNDRHQQRYLYQSWQYENTDYRLSQALLLGADHSHWWQLKAEWLPDWSLSFWLAYNGWQGNNQSEFGRAPWHSQISTGGQWVF